MLRVINRINALLCIKNSELFYAHHINDMGWATMTFHLSQSSQVLEELQVRFRSNYITFIKLKLSALFMPDLLCRFILWIYN